MFCIKVNCNKPTGFIVCKKESPVKFQVARGIWSARLLPGARPGIKGWDSLVALTHCVCPQCRKPGFDPWVGKIPWRRKWQPTPVLLPGKSHGWRSLVGYSPWSRKESDATERLHFLFFHPGIKGDLVHSNHLGLTVEEGWIPRGKSGSG